MDRASFLRNLLIDKYDEEIAGPLAGSRRTSTLRQQQVAWKALQKWLEEDDSRIISKTGLLKFILHLKRSRNLSARTIINYRAYLSQPISLASGIDLGDWEFKDLDKYFFLSGPTKRKHVPK